MVFKRYWAKRSRFIVTIYHYIELTMTSGNKYLIPEDYFMRHQDDGVVYLEEQMINMKYIESHKPVARRYGEIVKLDNNEIIAQGHMFVRGYGDGNLMSEWYLDTILGEIPTEYWMEQSNLVSQNRYKNVDTEF